jgi:hypothetical protein
MSAFGLRVIGCVLCCVACLPRVAAQANDTAPPAAIQNTPPPTSRDEGSVPLAAQLETMPPQGQPDVAPPPAAAPPAPATPAPPPAAIVQAPPPPAAKHAPPVVQGHDRERAPPRAPIDRDESPLLLRLSLGIEASFARFLDKNTLRRPTYASLDLGVKPCGHLGFLLRLASWLPYAPHALQFLGAGVDYRFSPEGMFFTGALGIAVRGKLSPKFNERLQGLAAQFDLGQQWPLTAALAFAVGVNLHVATPWLGAYDATEFGAGMFVAAAYR